MNMFTLVAFKTRNRYNKYDANKITVIGDRESIWHLWYMLTHELGYSHVAVYSLSGTKCQPELGINQGMFVEQLDTE